ncbi:uncharacterized protein LOC124683528 [Lolium rigidum]|uniref:uncharacterized protein LOC124683528 n=1 Tax=Lolium rigidum TaxID=89674 RepID=UPI001F5D6ECD|nr:uncharacterized protein LOC124683528 [Lolium rigidum]
MMLAASAYWSGSKTGPGCGGIGVVVRQHRGSRLRAAPASCRGAGGAAGGICIGTNGERPQPWSWSFHGGGARRKVSCVIGRFTLVLCCHRDGLEACSNNSEDAPERSTCWCECIKPWSLTSDSQLYLFVCMKIDGSVSEKCMEVGLTC